MKLVSTGRQLHEPVRKPALVHTVRAQKRGNPANSDTEFNSGPGPYPTGMPVPFHGTCTLSSRHIKTSLGCRARCWAPAARAASRALGDSEGWHKCSSSHGRASVMTVVGSRSRA